MSFRPNHNHDTAVKAIAKRATDLHNSKTPWRIYHGSTNSTRNITFDPARIIDTSSLNHILDIDPHRKIILVEPNVPMDKVVDTTLPHALLPPVVPEFPGITAGGSYAGTAAESSSFKHGFFDRAVNWIEMVLPTGVVVKASPTERSDLFHAAVNAYGTFGVITCLELQLWSTGRFVELTYLPVSGPGEAVSLMRSCAHEPFDYIDGILFTAHAGAVIVGRTTNARNYPVRRFTRARDPWFYLHAARKAHPDRHRRRPNGDDGSPTSSSPTSNDTTELVPIRDYLFRYDRGAFWMGRHTFTLFRCPFNRATRFLLDPLLRTRALYDAFQQSDMARRFIIQDLVLPKESAEPFVRWVDEKFGIYPLWICPIRADLRAPLQVLPGRSANGDVARRGRGQAQAEGKPGEETSDILINVGCWGPGPGGKRYTRSNSDRRRFVQDNVELEQKVTALGGKKWLYAQCFYNEQHFWELYDGEGGRGVDKPGDAAVGNGWYKRTRETYGCTGLPDLYEKVGSSSADFRGVSRLRALGRVLLRRRDVLMRDK